MKPLLALALAFALASCGPNEPHCQADDAVDAVVEKARASAELYYTDVLRSIVFRSPVLSAWQLGPGVGQSAKALAKDADIERFAVNTLAYDETTTTYSCSGSLRLVATDVGELPGKWQHDFNARYLVSPSDTSRGLTVQVGREVDCEGRDNDNLVSQASEAISDRVFAAVRERLAKASKVSGRQFAYDPLDNRIGDTKSLAYDETTATHTCQASANVDTYPQRTFNVFYTVAPSYSHGAEVKVGHDPCWSGAAIDAIVANYGARDYFNAGIAGYDETTNRYVCEALTGPRLHNYWGPESTFLQERLEREVHLRYAVEPSADSGDMIVQMVEVKNCRAVVVVDAVLAAARKRYAEAAAALIEDGHQVEEGRLPNFLDAIHWHFSYRMLGYDETTATYTCTADGGPSLRFTALGGHGSYKSKSFDFDYIVTPSFSGEVNVQVTDKEA